MQTVKVTPSPEARLFSRAWTALSTSVHALPATDFEQTSGCAGWRVRDLVCHLVIDVQDVLITLATPTADPVTTNAAGYWHVTPPPTGEDQLDALIPRLATAYGDPGLLTFHLRDLGDAAHRAALNADPDTHVQTQNMVLPVREYLRAYVLEWTLHHLDLRGALTRDDQPDPAALAETRLQLELVTGARFPSSIDDISAVQIITGRRPPSAAEAKMIGDDGLSGVPFRIG